MRTANWPAETAVWGRGQRPLSLPLNALIIHTFVEGNGGNWYIINSKTNLCYELEVPTAVLIGISVFWDVTSCRETNSSWCFVMPPSSGYSSSRKVNVWFRMMNLTLISEGSVTYYLSNTPTNARILSLII